MGGPIVLKNSDADIFYFSLLTEVYFSEVMFHRTKCKLINFIDQSQNYNLAIIYSINNKKLISYTNPSY